MGTPFSPVIHQPAHCYHRYRPPEAGRVLLREMRCASPRSTGRAWEGARSGAAVNQPFQLLCFQWVTVGHQGTYKRVLEQVGKSDRCSQNWSQLEPGCPTALPALDPGKVANPYLSCKTKAIAVFKTWNNALWWCNMVLNLILYLMYRIFWKRSHFRTKQKTNTGQVKTSWSQCNESLEGVQMTWPSEHKSIQNRNQFRSRWAQVSVDMTWALILSIALSCGLHQFKTPRVLCS